MDEKYTWFNTIINKIEFNMMRKADKCWIKAAPLNQISIPSSLHIILNDEYHHWDVYDENGKEAHKIYFKGENCNPSFYLKCKDKSYKIDCKTNEIKVTQINEAHTLDSYIKENCYCNSPQASCWAKYVFYTGRPDKPPFDVM